MVSVYVSLPSTAWKGLNSWLGSLNCNCLSLDFLAFHILGKVPDCMIRYFPSFPYLCGDKRPYVNYRGGGSIYSGFTLGAAFKHLVWSTIIVWYCHDCWLLLDKWLRKTQQMAWIAFSNVIVYFIFQDFIGNLHFFHLAPVFLWRGCCFFWTKNDSEDAEKSDMAVHQNYFPVRACAWQALFGERVWGCLLRVTGLYLFWSSRLQLWTIPF